MSDNIRKPFAWERITCDLPPFYALALRYDGHAQAHVSFQHERLTEQNTKLAHRKIWDEFKHFTRKCMRKIPHHRRFQKVSFLTSSGFPVARMPDNSEIITINDISDGFKIHFAWIVEQEGDHE